jgi:hypothetical protein
MSKMDKRALHYHYRRVRPIRPWYFLAIAVICFGLAVYGLRQNNLKMVELRQAVTAADESGGNVEKALRDLRTYVYRHMNTDLSGGQVAIHPPVQLKARYERLMAQEAEKVKRTNEEVKSAAESICAGRHPGGGYNSPRVQCVQNHVQENAAESGDVPEELYKFDFASPRWTPDLAGISLVLGVFFSALFVVWLVLDRWIQAKID